MPKPALWGTYKEVTVDVDNTVIVDDPTHAVDQDNNNVDVDNDIVDQDDVTVDGVSSNSPTKSRSLQTFSTCEIASPRKRPFQAAGWTCLCSGKVKRMSWLSNHWLSSQLRRRAVKVAKLVEPSALQLMPFCFCAVGNQQIVGFFNRIARDAQTELVA